MLGYYHEIVNKYTFIMPIFPLRYNGLQLNNTNKQSYIEFKYNNKIINIRCYNQQIEHQIIKSNNGQVYIAVIVYFCPIISEIYCNYLNLRKSDNNNDHILKPLNISLVTAYRHNNKKIGVNANLLKWTSTFTHELRPIDSDPFIYRNLIYNYFILNVLPSYSSLQIKNSNLIIPNIAVITTICYGSSNNNSQNAMNIISKNWIQHYQKLNMRIILYDVIGQRLENQNDLYINYHHYSIFSLLKISPPLNNNNERNYDPSINYAQSLTVFYDSDKSCTYTHARMEMSAIYNINNTLIIDFDEFLFCKDVSSIINNPNNQNNIYNYDIQIKLINKLINENNEIELSLSDLVPHKRIDMPIQDCLRNTTLKNESIFNCISSIDYATINSPKLKKALNTAITCP